MSERLRAYLPAALVGLALAIWLFPAEFLFPSAGLSWRPQGDAAQHAIAQRHFLAAPWRWPLLEVPTLLGTNLAFMDGIPALALVAKLFEPPLGFHAIGLFYALAWVAQGPAAVFALRGFGGRGAWPALAVALLALSMPAFIMRFGHAALTGHFLILLGLGLYPRLLRDGRWWVAAVALQLLALLVHPYLALMVLAVLGAVPLTLVLRRARWRPAALGAAAAAAAMGGTMAALGYLGAAGGEGYGAYALNLLSPVWPHLSLLLGGFVAGYVSATGGSGWEGYNWLGLGLVSALGIAAVLGGRSLARAVRRHAGLVLACLGLVALAVSFRVGFGPWILLDLGKPPGFLEQFRSSGRFFWPVGYALMLAAAVALARQGVQGRAILMACAVVQLLDATPQRLALHAWAHQRAAWSVPAEQLRPLLRKASSFTLFPSYPCTGSDWATQDRLLELLFLASETPRPVNTMYVARWREAPTCRDPEALRQPLRPGELRIALRPLAVPVREALPPGACSELGDLLVCR
jgi:hypothetical protein